MKSQEYRNTVARLARTQIKKALPGLKPFQVASLAKQIGIFVHARLYGADVDDVASPLYYDVYPDRLPTVPATELAANE